MLARQACSPLAAARSSAGREQGPYELQWTVQIFDHVDNLTNSARGASQITIRDLGDGHALAGNLNLHPPGAVAPLSSVEIANTNTLRHHGSRAAKAASGVPSAIIAKETATEVAYSCYGS